jgi:diadenylate cyclase
MQQLLDLVGGLKIEPTSLLDIALTALLIYGLFSLIQGTRAVRLVIGAILLYVVYVIAQALNLRLLTAILQTGAVVGLLALVVIFQPELRRALERIGRVGSLSWVMAPSGAAAHAERVAAIVSRTASALGAHGIGALIVIERETGLEDSAESGVMLHADLSQELLQSIFTPHTALHDGAVLIRGDRILAAGVVLPLSETSIHRERYGTRHRAAIGISEQTDAVAVVVSEETRHTSLVERGRVLRSLDEDRLRTALLALLRPPDPRGRAANSVNSVAALGRSQLSQGRRLPGAALRRGSRAVRATSTPAAAAGSVNVGGTASNAGTNAVSNTATIDAATSTSAGTPALLRPASHAAPPVKRPGGSAAPAASNPAPAVPGPAGRVE